MFPSYAYKCRRKNYVQSAYVNAALALLEVRSSEHLISMLRNLAVPDHVILRVLSSAGPVRNRQPDEAIHNPWQ